MKQNLAYMSVALLQAAVSASVYTYGNDCGTVTDQDCGLVPGCTQCAFSYPTNDPDMWSSSEARCRCRNPEQSAVEAAGGLSQYFFGGDCATLTDQDCGSVAGCTRCQFSYPVGDPMEWSSSDAMCRCSSDSGSGGSGSGGNDSGSTDNSSINYEFGGACENNQDDDCSLVAGCNSCQWSWPADDPLQWDSNDAKCRCNNDNNDSGSNNDNSTTNPDKYYYEWGGNCLTNQDDDCSQVSGCNRCLWSWPADDPLQWDSNDAKCRCQTDDLRPTQYDRDDLYFGDDCSSLID